MEQHVQVSLVTKSKCFSVPSSPITISRSCSPTDLNKLLKELLKESGQSECDVEFAFLVGGELLTSSLHEFLMEKEIFAELIELEYFEKQKPPDFYMQLEHDDLISCVKRNQPYVLTGSYDGTLRIWTMDGTRSLCNLELDDKVKCIEWLSLDIKKLGHASFVSGGFDHAAHIWSWDLESPKADCVALCRGHSETIMSITAVMDPASGTAKHFATGSWDKTIKIWSASLEPTDLFEETGGISHVRKSANKIPTRIPRMTLAGHREAVTCVCWLPESLSPSDRSKSSGNHLLSVSWDHTLRLWDCDEGREFRCILSNHALHDADAALQGILTASSDNCVRIFDPRTPEALALSGFRGHTGWLTAVTWAPHNENQFVTGSIDRSVRLWDTRNPRTSLYNLMGHGDIVTDVDWAPALEIAGTNGSHQQHYILSSSADATVKIYRCPE